VDLLDRRWQCGLAAARGLGLTVGSITTCTTTTTTARLAAARATATRCFFLGALFVGLGSCGLI
jgi:hypothetical protein